MDWLVKGLIAIGGALLADAAVHQATGKHIHQHVVELWNQLRERLLVWARDRGYSAIQTVIIEIDGVFQAANRIANAKVKYWVNDGAGRVEYKEEVVQVEELKKMGIEDCTPGNAFDISELVLES